ncbi:MAG: sugar phosphorylase [Victivallaceae bacterium]|nr:sugar phosphorylase [Victivallaceae bacterium]
MTLPDILTGLYGAGTAAEYHRKIQSRISDFRKKHPAENAPGPDESDAVLISYGDMTGSGAPGNPLRTLENFLREYAADIISTVHILPFFPYSSDDGFSVIDYREVNPALGNWDDVEAFTNNFSLAFDAVFNHISRQSDWFQGFLKNDPQYAGWFIEPGEDFNFSRVFRPRALPLFHNCEDIGGKIRRVWTTFSEDQVDLNFKSPELMLELIDILLLYLEKGARIIRLDAIAFCWKESGTACLHRQQAHLIVKLFRRIAEEAMPGALILTETNVPHLENISYFGDCDEADMVYQFPLPPLTAQAILRNDATALSNWAAKLEEPPGGCTFLNFLASHDGVGLRPLSGLAPDRELSFLAGECLRKGGKVGYRNNPDGSQSPYELNINYYSLLQEPGEALKLSVRKFILAQAIMLSMPGIPGIYFHSLFGSENWTEGLPENSENRTINREKIPAGILRKELDSPGSRRKLIYEEYRKLLLTRKRHPAFHPKSGFKILRLLPELFAVIRGTRQEKALLALFNVSGDTVELSVKDPAIPRQLYSLFGRKVIRSDKISLEAFEFDWLACRAG